jgi:hypothetical protein
MKSVADDFLLGENDERATEEIFCLTVKQNEIL